MRARMGARTVPGSGGWSRECPATVRGWLSSDQCRPPVLGRGVARNRNGTPSSGLPAVAYPIGESSRRFGMFIIGIDPHKASHTAAVLDGHEQLVSEIRVCADGSQRD